MAHNLFGERFLGRREPAWHGLGTVFPADEVMTPAEAIVRAGCDYEVRKLPLTCKLPNGSVVSADRVALVRCPAPLIQLQSDNTYKEVIDPNAADYHILGYASNQYEIVNNLELGFMLEGLGEKWPVETVGALGNGETLFVTLDAGRGAVGRSHKDEIRNFLLISNHHDGKRALRIMLTPVRVVCENTLVMATSQAIISATIPHSSTVKGDTDFRLKLFESVKHHQDQMMEQFNVLAERQITEKEADLIFARAYPDPRPTRKSLTADIIVKDNAMMGIINDDRTIAEKLLADVQRNGETYERQMAKMIELREFAKDRFERTGNESPDISGTAWAAWQGVTEVENYRGTATKDTATSVLFGDRARTMATAFNACLELVAVRK